MNAIAADNFALEIKKYFEMAKSHMIEIAYGDEVFCLKKKKAKTSEGWIPTAQDLEDIRIGREQWERGEHAQILHGESLDDFLKRIGKI